MSIKSIIKLPSVEQKKGSPCEREQLLSDQWRSAVNSGRDQLECHDLRQVLALDSWEDLQDQIQKSRADLSTHQEFAMLAHSFLKLRTFTDTWMRQVCSRVDTSVFWGFTSLILKVCYSLTRRRS